MSVTNFIHMYGNGVRPRFDTPGEGCNRAGPSPFRYPQDVKWWEAQSIEVQNQTLIINKDHDDNERDDDDDDNNVSTGKHIHLTSDMQDPN